jgi:hypothetical protein
MKRLYWLIAAALLLPLLAPRAAGAWPEPIHAFMAGMEKGDAAMAANAFTADATFTLPLEMLALDSALAPDGVRQAGARVTLTGRAQIRAWLEEFIGRYQGRMYLQGPAQFKGATLATRTTVTGSYLPDVRSGWIAGTGEFGLDAPDGVTAFALVLPPAELQRLRVTSPESYNINTPAIHASPGCARAL